MSFFRKLFSSDYRAALAAEAAGDLELAAQRYALAGRRDSAARLHLARAERADSRAAELAALHDALHWAPEEGGWRRRAAHALGEALVARGRAEGIATERDRQHIRRAAALLEEAGSHVAAGEALASIGDDRAAAEAFERGGAVDRMEELLVRTASGGHRERRAREAHADYELYLRSGDRDGALGALRRGMEESDHRGPLRQLLGELEARRIASGRATIAREGGLSAVYCGNQTLSLGRDPLCDLVLRSSGVSRKHAVLHLEQSGGDLEVLLTDADSRNGIYVDLRRAEGELALRGSGTFSLGEECAIDYELRSDPAHLQLAIRGGLDRGGLLLAAPNAPLPLAPLGVAAELAFRDGRPFLLEREGGIALNGKLLVRGDVQLIHGDALSIDGHALEVR